MRTPGAPLKPNQPKTFDKNKVRSIFDKAKDSPEPPPRKKKAASSVGTQTAQGTSKPPQQRNETVTVPPADEEAKGKTAEMEVIKEGLPTITADEAILAPQREFRTLDPKIYQELPDRPGVELPKGGAQLPGTGLPGKDGIGGLRGGLQGGLTRPEIGHDTGEEAYQDAAPGGYNPATDPSGAMGEAGGWLGTAGQAYGGKGGKTMEQIGGIMQSGSGGEAAGKGADILLPGSGKFVEAAVGGDTAGMVNAGATAAGQLASDLVIGLIIGFAGGGLIGMAVGYALSATGAGRAIADGVTAGIKWIAEKVGVGGNPPPEPPPEPAPSPDPGMYDENHSKNNGKKGPSVINENQIRPLQDQLNEDLLGENRDKEQFVDTSDTPAPRKVAFAQGCDPDELAGKGGGSINLKDPFTIKDMEKPGYDKY
ncbi:hypothetical protein [Prosthecobacter fusiformis]|nr:hypothetical protein [Prosthecobacter fusiformis]